MHVWPCSDKRCPGWSYTKRDVEEHEATKHGLVDTETFWKRVRGDR